MNGCVDRAACYIFIIKRFFQPNIGRQGRTARGVIGTICLITGIMLVDRTLTVGLIFVVAGLLAIFEALRGWCVARACGIRTKM